MQTGLARAVRIVFETRHPQRVDATNVDDARGIAPSCGLVGGALRWLGCLFQQRREELREREDALQVQREKLGPGMVRVRVKRLAPSGARVVDEDVQTVWLALGEGGRKRLAGVEGLEVSGQGDGGATRAGGFSCGFGSAEHQMWKVAVGAKGACLQR